MAAKKPAASKSKAPKADTKKTPRTKKCKTSSQPGEAAEAHQWLMKRLEEQDEQPVADELPIEVHDIPDEDDTTCGPSEDDLADAEMDQAAIAAAIAATGKDPRTGQFVKGFYKGGPGRKKGSRNRLGEDFIADLHADWEQHGIGVIAQVREARPADYLKIVASILPKQMDVRVSELAELNDDALDKRLAQMQQELSTALAILKPQGAVQ